MRFENLIIGLVLFSMVITAGVIMIGDLDASYDDVNMSSANDAFNDIYTDINEVYNDTQEIRAKTIDADVTDEESWNSMTKGAYSAIRLIPKTFKLTQGIINAIATEMGLSCTVNGERQKVCIFVDGFMIILTVIVLFSIIYTIFRFIPR